MDAQQPGDGSWMHWPLRATTSDRWAAHVLEDPSALLGDHAHLERKAASNALELLTRCPWHPDAGDEHARRWSRWTKTLANIARDESLHLAQVLSHIGRLGGVLPPRHANPYAQSLRANVRRGEGRRELLDRLLVSALIEARSCERFERLMASADTELAGFYRSLVRSEAGHHRQFLELARMIDDSATCAARYDVLLDAEVSILASLPIAYAMHSGDVHMTA